MNITKDEARILSSALSNFKYDLKETQNIQNLFDKLTQLEEKLENYAKDKRRTGRTSQDSWTDLLKRI
jgi:hypothetical protein